MSQPQNRYKADLREVYFRLFEQFDLDDILSKPPFEEWGSSEIKMVIDECYRFATEVVGPTNAVGDRVGCQLVDGAVKTPPGFKQAWDRLYEAGWRSIDVDPAFDGQGAPHVVQSAAEELLTGANPAFMMYPGLSHGAAELIAHCGTDEQRERFAKPLFNGRYGGTMCLTEPQAGSDVGASRTTAKKRSDGSYSIAGTKIFISSGDHDLAENVIHLVLARIEGADPGTKGLSLFIVPKLRLKADGSAGEANDVKVAGIEHKMGLNGSATCQLAFGDEGECHGYLVGGVEHQGIKQMFLMMNGARILVGVQSLAVAAGAYMSALEYARDRKQGPSADHWKNPTAPRVSILEHADIRRMLLEMKAKTEGIRALIYKLSMHRDRERALADKDDESAQYHRGQVELLTPLVKGYSSEEAFHITQQAIQVLGGSGYIADYPVEQACRDSKVFTIYEGTTHIQALDLVGRKLGLAGGKYAKDFFADVTKFTSEKAEHEVLGPSVKQLKKAQEAVGAAALQLVEWVRSGKMKRVPLQANRFLMMMSELTLGWLLLDGAAIAHTKQQDVAKEHPDHAFYEGKKASAIFFAHNVLPTVIAKAKMLQGGDDSALTIPDAAFASV